VVLGGFCRLRHWVGICRIGVKSRQFWIDERVTCRKSSRCEFSQVTRSNKKHHGDYFGQSFTDQNSHASSGVTAESSAPKRSRIICITLPAILQTLAEVVRGGLQLYLVRVLYNRSWLKTANGEGVLRVVLSGEAMRKAFKK
jgi:hypothetical protein